MPIGRVLQVVMGAFLRGILNGRLGVLGSLLLGLRTGRLLWGGLMWGLLMGGLLRGVLNGRLLWGGLVRLTGWWLMCGGFKGCLLTGAGLLVASLLVRGWSR